MIYLAAARGAAAGPFGANADPLLWQGYFWFAVQPLAIFALLPAAGVITEVIAGIARRPGRRLPHRGRFADRAAGPGLLHLGRAPDRQGPVAVP